MRAVVAYGAKAQGSIRLRTARNPRLSVRGDLMWGSDVFNSAQVAASWACGARCAILSLSMAHILQVASLAV